MHDKIILESIEALSKKGVAVGNDGELWRYLW